MDLLVSSLSLMNAPIYLPREIRSIIMYDVYKRYKFFVNNIPKTIKLKSVNIDLLECLWAKNLKEYSTDYNQYYNKWISYTKYNYNHYSKGLTIKKRSKYNHKYNGCRWSSDYDYEHMNIGIEVNEITDANTRSWIFRVHSDYGDTIYKEEKYGDRAYFTYYRSAKLYSANQSPYDIIHFWFSIENDRVIMECDYHNISREQAFSVYK
jgi:hypothetical protein